MPRRAMGDSKHGTSGERVAFKKLGKVNEWQKHTTSGWEFPVIPCTPSCASAASGTGSHTAREGSCSDCGRLHGFAIAGSGPPAWTSADAERSAHVSTPLLLNSQRCARLPGQLCRCFGSAVAELRPSAPRGASLRWPLRVFSWRLTCALWF
jgi:hypothetical protein